MLMIRHFIFEEDWGEMQSNEPRRQKQKIMKKSGFLTRILLYTKVKIANL